LALVFGGWKNISSQGGSDAHTYISWHAPTFGSPVQYLEVVLTPEDDSRGSRAEATHAPVSGKPDMPTGSAITGAPIPRFKRSEGAKSLKLTRPGPAHLHPRLSPFETQITGCSLWFFGGFFLKRIQILNNCSDLEIV
jgi:hypothetical protein